MVDHSKDHDIKSRMQVFVKHSNDPTVLVSPIREWDRFNDRIRLGIARMRNSSFRTNNPVLHSPALRRSGWAEELNASDADLLHLQWVGQWQGHVPTLSVEEIGCLRKPIVWTLHDQWAFCGAEHYVMPPPAVDERFIFGYTNFNRLSHERGADLNRRTWNRKRKAWQQPLQIVCPSHWMADCVRRSALMQEWPVEVIPTPIDLNTFKPFDPKYARDQLGLPQNVPLLLFGAVGGISDSRKGFDLLLAALAYRRSDSELHDLSELQLIVLGEEGQAGEAMKLGFPIHNPGHISNDAKLSMYYSAADAVVVPSRLDNLPNIAIEAHACGTPVVAFRTSGLQDIIDDRITGAFAKPFEVASLRQEIAWVLADPDRTRRLGEQARSRAELLWAPARIASLYANVYRMTLASNMRGS
ncbi:glycosyltransferase [Synechococcus sp. CCY 9618]|uniref:glycosyltransferase n=1 Tax=Synechococcus sp. CCY 9618 TaxID=2815602 RepID=UPI0020B27F02